ncbi:MAG: DUF99 family protein [Candidatus Hydrothermarchaeaceae archaeon]
MRLHTHKKGLRALGMAESFQKGRSVQSQLAGVVMRGDLLIDGFALETITVGGLDATEGVLRLCEGLERRDINLILLNGCVISWYNIIDLEAVYEALGIPLVCVTYEESEGLEKYFREFEDGEERIEIYKRLGKRMPIKLRTGHEVLVRHYGMEDDKEAKRALDMFTLQGAVPEPLKVARLLARAAMKKTMAN